MCVTDEKRRQTVGDEVVIMLVFYIGSLSFTIFYLKSLFSPFDIVHVESSLKLANQIEYSQRNIHFCS